MKIKTATGKSDIGGVFDCQCDVFFTLIKADDSLYKMLGYTKEEFEELFNNQLLFSIYEEERTQIDKEIRRQVKENGVFMYENRLICKGNTLKWVWISAQLMSDENEKYYYHCIFHDITKNKVNEEDLKISKQRLDFILSQTQDIIFEYDCALNEIYYSDNLEKKFGYTIPAKGFPDSMFKTNIIYEEDVLPLRNGFQSIIGGKNEMQCEYRLKYRSKGYRWVHLQATALRDSDNKLIKIIGIITDIHDQRQEILKSRQEAALDPLTGVFNRRECIRCIENYISVTDALFAFILIDVDDFKMINDVYGHSKGDLTLRKISEELTSVIRKNDMIARIGGDEFVICLMNLPDAQVAFNKVERIQNIFGESLKDAFGFKINCSIGISFYPTDGLDFTSLLECADLALYEAKKDGKGRYRVYQQGKSKNTYHILPQKYMQKTFHDRIIEYTLQCLLEESNRQIVIPSLLEMMARAFDCDRITIYELYESSYYKTFQYVRENIYVIEEEELTIAADLINVVTSGNKFFAYENVQLMDDEKIKAWFLDRNTISSIVYYTKDIVDTHILILYEDCHSTRTPSGEIRYSIMMVSEMLQLFLQS
ncbi:MAG: diguanylate cyclase [Beduini sp.]|uniref:sensor domain-containing diguanylate cyclase n=1 Tax=Beduini sp. TaxID=1922300 RepID=UPI0039A027D6